MTMPFQHRKNRREKREGAALLIVLFILLMSTGTAVFAMQSTQFEQRAAGSLHQVTRAKYVAEAATVNVLALCYQGGTTGCTDIKRDSQDLSGENRQRFGMPNYGAAETIYSLTQADFPIAANTNFLVDAIDTDKELGAARASTYTPAFMSVLEKWEVPNPGETRQRYRLIVSTYGAVGVGTDVQATGELRGGHEAISATRAFFDVR